VNAPQSKRGLDTRRWVAAGAFEQGVVEDALYAAAARNGLLADDGDRRCWATIRSGLGVGLQNQK